jgi:hypothetical protein
MKTAKPRAKVHRTPKLERVSLRGATGHEIPGFKPGRKHYIAKIDGKLYFGTFSRQWYGWNFDCGFGMGVGLQFDAPGWNSSGWQALWEIKT